MTRHTFFSRHTPKDTAPKLRLVALMDIFTILVFFLLLSTGQSNSIENAKFVKLPESTSEISAPIHPILSVKQNSIWLNDKLITASFNEQQLDDQTKQRLKDALYHYAEQTEFKTQENIQHSLSITLMGDQSTPFWMINDIMKVLQDTNFRDIFLAGDLISGGTYE